MYQSSTPVLRLYIYQGHYNQSVWSTCVGYKSMQEGKRGRVRTCGAYFIDLRSLCTAVLVSRLFGDVRLYDSTNTMQQSYRQTNGASKINRAFFSLSIWVTLVSNQ